MSASAKNIPAISLALQGGGTHGAFTWGVVDRLLEEAEAGRLNIKAIKRRHQCRPHRRRADRGWTQCGAVKADGVLAGAFGGWLLAGNALAFGEPGPSGWNIDDGTVQNMGVRGALVVSSGQPGRFQTAAEPRADRSIYRRRNGLGAGGFARTPKLWTVPTLQAQSVDLTHFL
jgi:hypothetical protein